MDGNRSVRNISQSRIFYAESEGSIPSPEQSPSKNEYRDDGAEEEDDGEEDEEDDGTGYGPALKQDRSSRGYTLRAKPNVSLKGSESAQTRRSLNLTPNTGKKDRASKGSYGKKVGRPYKGSTPKDSQDNLTERNLMRNHISTVTTVKRERFLLHHRNLFLPLLPERNYITKLVEKHVNKAGHLDHDEMSQFPIVEYENLEEQPKGIRATMKPYQLSGLSFMVYLHRNGLSGILGDEMGLGKTLQTISLIQYLKENEPTVGEANCPFLVICPLSVLSSWMAELARWAPSLKVIRFHGPVKERTRLKRVAVGDIDNYGNETHRHKSKVNARRTAKGKMIISLDSDDDQDSREVDVIITTYESYLAEQAWIKRAFVWRYVILDEGHKIKNDLSLVSKALQGLQAEHRLILTGTPLQNNLQELWALLHWLYPDVFVDKTSELFSNSFNLSKGKYSDLVVDNSRKLLELIMLRRMKDSPGVNLGLPPKTEVLLFVPLSPMQRFWYMRMITKADSGLLDDLFKGAKDKEQKLLEQDDDAQAKLVNQHAAILASREKGSDEWKESIAILEHTIKREEGDIDTSKAGSWRSLMNLMMQLRKISTHPYQIRNAEPDPYINGEHVITASGKFMVLEKLIMELVVKQQKKILIFSTFTRVLDLVEDLLALRSNDGRGFKHLRLDGQTGRARRNLAIRLFNQTDSEYKIMLISTKAGGLGINLATASDVILLDQDWNPQITLQAEARAHRIGQVNPVTVYKLISQGTVEEQMMGRINKKLYLSAKVTEAMEDSYTLVGKKSKEKRRPGQTEDENAPNMNFNQLMTLVRRGTAAVSRPEIDINEMLSWSWEQCLDACKDKPLDVQLQKDAVPDAVVDKKAEAKWLSEMERVESTIFEGKKLHRSTKRNGVTNGDIQQEWQELDRSSRREGKNTTVMIDGYAIDKNSMGCAQWEAVPTLAGKDSRLASPKREKRAKINNQGHCQVCMDGGEIHLCQHCPRSYHLGCLDKEYQMKAKSTMFICPQHQCNECEQKTADAGGMLYRCRWCERAYCEDCLHWEKTELLGENLQEYELLSYPAGSQAFYIQCHQCTEHYENYPEDKRYSDAIAKDAARSHALKFNPSATSSRAGSLTDATTMETNSIETPIPIGDDDVDDDEIIEVPRPKNVIKLFRSSGAGDWSTTPSNASSPGAQPQSGTSTPKGKRKLGDSFSSDLRRKSGSKQKLPRSNI